MRSSKALLSSRVIPANTPYHSCKYSTGTSRTIWYGYNCNCQFKESIQTYNIRLVCTVIRLLRYLQYCQRICNLESKNWRLLIRLVCTVIHYLQYLIWPQRGLHWKKSTVDVKICCPVLVCLSTEPLNQSKKTDKLGCHSKIS